MKTITCRELGGPCEFAHHGETADEVIKAQDRHLKERAGAGDDSHQDAFRQMKGRWRHPISGMGWYKSAKKNFADRPEGQAQAS
jgi:predicted small metal-binding protein